MKKRTTRMLLAGLLAVACVLTGCGGSAAATTEGGSSTGAAEGVTAEATEALAEKDTLIVALQGEPSTLDVQYADDTNMFWITWQTNEPLVVYNGETLEIEPLLATEWENTDDTTWIFTIRDGVKFHDGSDMTADDVAYSINRIISPDYGSEYASDFSTIDGAEVTGDNQVTITTNGPDPILLKRLTKLSILSQAFADGKSSDELTTVENGTGPYKLDNWASGDSITLSSFADYWGDAPAIPNLTFRFISEATTRVSALQKGEIDIAVNMLPEYVDELPQVITGEGNENYFIRLNATSGIMENPDLRLACNYAVDKEAIANDLFLGYATPEAAQLGAEGTTGYTSSIEAYPYDIDKAKELIASSGYNGEEIQLISEKTRWTKDGEVTEAVAAMLQEAGLNVTVKFVSWNEWLDILFDKEQTPDMMFSSTSDEMKDIDRFLSSGVHSEGTQSAMANPEYDAIIEAAQLEMDPEKRQAMYDELNTMLYNDPPRLYLVRVNELHGAATYVDWTLRNDCRYFFKEVSFK